MPVKLKNNLYLKCIEDDIIVIHLVRFQNWDDKTLIRNSDDNWRQSSIGDIKVWTQWLRHESGIPNSQFPSTIPLPFYVRLNINILIANIIVSTTLLLLSLSWQLSSLHPILSSSYHHALRSMSPTLSISFRWQLSWQQDMTIVSFQRSVHWLQSVQCQCWSSKH